MMIKQLLQQILRYTMVYPHHQLLTIMKSSYIITNGPFLLIVRINYTTLYHLCSHDYSKKYGIWVFFSMRTQTTRSFLVRNSSGKLTVISQLFLQSGQIPRVSCSRSGWQLLKSLQLIVFWLGGTRVIFQFHNTDVKASS